MWKSPSTVGTEVGWRRRGFRNELPKKDMKPVIIGIRQRSTLPEVFAQTRIASQRHECPTKTLEMLLANQPLIVLRKEIIPDDRVERAQLSELNALNFLGRGYAAITNDGCFGEIGDSPILRQPQLGAALKDQRAHMLGVLPRLLRKINQ